MAPAKDALWPIGFHRQFAMGEEGMRSEPRSVFLLVRRCADLERVNAELAGYLAIRRRYSPGRAPEPIQGIWIDDEGVANLPSALLLADPAGARRTVRILETTGINGIWMLCWLEAAGRTVSRVDLVAALLECFGHEETKPAELSARFIPAFSCDPCDGSAQEELHALALRYPGLVLSPICVDDTGVLRLPEAQLHAGGMPS